MLHNTASEGNIGLPSRVSIERYLTPTIATESDEDSPIINGFDQQLYGSYQRIMGDKFSRTLTYFLEDSTIMLGKLQAAHQQENLQELSVIAHTLKSTSAAIGAVEFSDIALQIEEEAKQCLATGNTENIPSHLLERLRIAFETVESQLNSKAV